MRKHLLTNRSLLLYLCLMSIGGCDFLKRESDWALVQPYIHPIAGIGGGRIQGNIIIPQDQEHIFVTQALVLSLQDQQLSVISPRLELDGVIPDNTEWITDIAPIPQSDILGYNKMYPHLKLRRAINGISYSGLHDTAGGKLRYRISALLYERGALSSKWSRVADERYAGNYFVSKLVKSIQKRLIEERISPP